jgi:hypothetical protein
LVIGRVVAPDGCVAGCVLEEPGPITDACARLVAHLRALRAPSCSQMGRGPIFSSSFQSDSVSRSSISSETAVSCLGLLEITSGGLISPSCRATVCAAVAGFLGDAHPAPPSPAPASTPASARRTAASVAPRRPEFFCFALLMLKRRNPSEPRHNRSGGSSPSSFGGR